MRPSGDPRERRRPPAGPYLRSHLPRSLWRRHRREAAESDIIIIISDVIIIINDVTTSDIIIINDVIITSDVIIGDVIIIISDIITSDIISPAPTPSHDPAIKPTVFRLSMSNSPEAPDVLRS